MNLNLEDFYQALSPIVWKSGLEVRRDLCHIKQIPNPDEVEGFFRQLYWEWKLPVYASLAILVKRELAETSIRPPTDSEVEKYVRIQLPPQALPWEGTRVYRRSSTGILIPESSVSLEEWIPQGI